MLKRVAQHVEARGRLLLGEVFQHAFHHHNDRLVFGDGRGPRAIKRIAVHHDTAVTILIDLTPHGNLVGQVNIEPTDAPVIYLAELVVKAAPKVDARRLGIARDEPAQRVSKHNGARDHALVREERIVLAHVHAQRVNDLLCLLVADTRVGMGRLTRTDSQRDQRGLLDVAKLQIHVMLLGKCVSLS